MSPWRAAVLLLCAALGSGGYWLASLKDRVDSRFQVVRDAPSRVYARPMVLVRGMDPVEVDLQGHLERVGYRAVTGPAVSSGEFARTTGAWILGLRPFRHAHGTDPGGVVTVRLDGGGRIETLTDDLGRSLARVRIEPAEISAFVGAEGQDRILVPLDEVPEHLVEAVLASEDQRFFEHPGIDVRRIAAAALANLRAGRVVQGGSTITQQLAKSLYLSPERSFARKIREALIALMLEWSHSKQEILEAYLNQVYLGQAGSVSVHGVGLAARRYYGRDIRELGLAESAQIVALIRAPSVYNPFRDPAVAMQRRDLVLGRMLEQGRITGSEHSAALMAEPDLRPEVREVRSASYFVDFLGKKLAERLGHEALERRGLSIFTTLDLGMQELAENALRQRLPALEREFGELERERAPLQAALLVLEPRTGQVLAMVGGRDYERSPFNRATSARRQPGSVFKPVVALAALGRRSGGPPDFTLASRLADEPLRIRTPAGLWDPVNHDDRFRGAVTVREALEQSLNVPIARLGATVGFGRIISTARRMGIESPLEPIPSLPLGSFETTLLEITRAYAVLASGGSRPPIRTTLNVTTSDGASVLGEPVEPLRVFEPAETYLVTSALQGSVDRGTSSFLRQFGYRGAAAAKTGSTNLFRDAWFVAYTPEIVVGTWAGFDDNRMLGLPGAAIALPIGADFMLGLLGPQGGAPFRTPPGIERARVAVEVGGRCRALVEVFLSGSVPPDACDPGGPSSTDEGKL